MTTAATGPTPNAPDQRQFDAPSSDSESSPRRTKWTIGAVSTETKVAVKRAASKEGVTISDWVDRTLRDAAVDTLKGGTPVLALPPDLLETMDDILQKLDRIDAEVQKDPDRSATFSDDFRERLEELRTGMSSHMERLRSSTNTMVDTVVEQTDAALSHSKRFADQALDRLIETSDAAVDGIRRMRGSTTDEESKETTPGDTRPEAKR